MKTTKLFLSLLLAAPMEALATENVAVNTTPRYESRIDTSKVVDLDEIIVVSQPKEVLTLRRQPISSTVFTEHELTTLNINNMSQLSSLVPTMVIPQYGSRLTSSTYIRGIGSRTGSSAVEIGRAHV